MIQYMSLATYISRQHKNIITNIKGMAQTTPPPTNLIPPSTQGQLVKGPVNPPEVVQRLTFASETVKRLTADDFDLTSKELITLKYDDCILVLFHVENTESYQLANIWALVAQQVAGPVFGAINMLSERRVAEAFTRLKSDGSNPFHWAALRQYPYILVYRKRWPVAVYNGPRDVQALIDYALTLACEAGYYEILQTGGGMQSESQFQMADYKPYTNIAGQPPVVKKDSLQFNTGQIRGFNRNLPITATPETTTGTTTGTEAVQGTETAPPTAETTPPAEGETVATPVPVT